MPTQYRKNNISEATMINLNASYTLAIIPARAGSKGIENKNLMQIGSKNLIEHAIHAAQASKMVTHIVVTSDHPDILHIAKTQNVFYRNRPTHMALDESPVVPALQDATLFMENKTNHQYNNIILLQPTSPIRTGEDIDKVISIMNKNPNIQGVISVSNCGVFLPDHQYYLKRDSLLNTNTLQPLTSHRNQIKRRQEIPESYVRNGAIYAARKTILMNENKIIVDNKVPYIMPKKYICNLDDYDDLELARIVIPAWEQNLL